MHMQLDHGCVFVPDITDIITTEKMDYSAR